MELIEWARLQEELLKAQLGIIRSYLRSGTPDRNARKIPDGQGKSQMSIIIDILSSVGTPVHISEIISQAKERYGVNMDRESAVSALTKKVKKGATFIRTAPNTFGLKER
jgi:hypothetical protein